MKLRIVDAHTHTVRLVDLGSGNGRHGRGPGHPSGELVRGERGQAELHRAAARESKRRKAA